MGIFSENAGFYWAAGLPVVPLKKWDSPAKGAGKAPILNEWTAYADNMPTEAMQKLWLGSYPDSNIGLPFGPASGLCAIDIDTEDEKLVEVILGALPRSPWKRVGKKGMGLIYRWQGQPNFKLRDGDNQSIVEFLGKGNQMVMPPSIHPDTGKPYTANTDLWKVLESIPAIGVDVEKILREALSEVAGISLAQTGRSGPIDVVPQGERDIQMVRHAGYLARVVLGIDKNQKFSLAEAMQHMGHWVEEFTAHTAGGDDMDPDKGIAKLVEFLLKDVESGRTLPNGWDEGLSDEQRDHPAIAAMIEKNAVQRWTYDKAVDWLEAQIAIEPTKANWAFEKVQEIVEALAKDENFSEMEFKTFCGKINGIVSGLIKFSKTDLVAAFKSARRGEVELAEDHEAIAMQVVDKMGRGGAVRFSLGRFWQWSGAHYMELEHEDVYMEIAQTVKGNTLARRHGDYEALVKTVSRVCRGDLGRELEDGVNFANGFLDSDLKLHEHSPKYGKTFTLPFNYVPERAAEAHKWFEYLERCWGDDEDYAEKVASLQEAFAATMFGIAPKYQRAFLLFGKAGTGKTQALEVLKALMPRNAQCSVSPTLWAERFQLCPLVGKTLNVCGELPEEGVIDGRLFKEVVEGTDQNTEFKGGQIFQFKPQAAQWFASNFLPRSRDTSKGFVRRWQIWEFSRVISSVERIVNFHEMLIAEEREAIAAWAVQGLSRLIRQKDYTQGTSQVSRLNQIARANNSVAAFLQTSDRCRPQEGAEADVLSVFDQYVEFMKTVSRTYPVPYERFMQMLEELGYSVGTYVDGVGALRHEVKGIKAAELMHRH